MRYRQTRKCHAHADADADRIHAKNNMSTSPSVGDIMSPNDADGMANSVDPDQAAPRSGSALFAQAYLSENLESLW